MKKIVVKLFYLLLLSSEATATEDSFSLYVKANACSLIEGTLTKEDAKFKAYDKATLLAVKNSQYIQEKNLNLNDYDYNLLSYKIADRALDNITLATTTDTKDKVCLEFKATLNKEKTDAILKDYGYKEINDEKIKEITEEVNKMLPKSIYETDNSMPLFFIENLEYYTNATTKAYTTAILEQLSSVPRVLVTDKKELADYYILPKLIKSSVDAIDGKNSRYGISVKIEVSDKNNEIVLEDTKNRYIIIDNNEDKQKLAQKMLTKLLKESVSSLSNKLSILFIENKK
ncbi:MAG: hypothetical protein IKW39_02725 [Alphaproteobacteria bacterium]|nr:hypothetical protein [Alphaproteobacteria bacterium]